MSSQSHFYFHYQPVQNVFHVKCLTNMHKVGKLLKCHFTVVPKPHFLLHSVMLHRYQDNFVVTFVTLHNAGKRGWFVLNYSSCGSVNRYGRTPRGTVFCAGKKTCVGKNFQRQSG